MGAYLIEITLPVPVSGRNDRLGEVLPASGRLRGMRRHTKCSLLLPWSSLIGPPADIIGRPVLAGRINMPTQAVFHRGI